MQSAAVNAVNASNFFYPEPRQVEENAEAEDYNDDATGSWHTEVLSGLQRIADCQVTTYSHGHGQPATTQQETVDTCKTIGSINQPKIYTGALKSIVT